MTTSIAAASSAAAASSSAVSGSKSLAQNFDTFLTLLTTQLRNQDPLKPMESDKFTEQLATFTGVEQQISTNKNLEQLVAMLSGSQSASALGYIGRSVEASGAVTELRDGKATWSYTLAAPATKVAVTVYDSNNVAVRTVEGAAAKGSHSFVWDGRDNNGNALPAANYRIDIKATDASGGVVSTKTSVQGVVSAVENLASGAILIVDGRRIPVSDVLRVAAAD